MLSKELYCYRILKTYSLLVDFVGEPPGRNVPSPVEGETYRQWQDRVLGNKVSDVVLYKPYEPAPQTRLNTLQNQASACSLEKMFQAFAKEKDRKTREKVEDAAASTADRYQHFPRDTLNDICAELAPVLVPSVKELLDRFQEGATDLKTEALIRQLIVQYNDAVLALRKETALARPAS